MTDIPLSGKAELSVTDLMFMCHSLGSFCMFCNEISENLVKSMEIKNKMWYTVRVLLLYI